MDRISDSGSDGCGSIPHGSTKRWCKSTIWIDTGGRKVKTQLIFLKNVLVLLYNSKIMHTFASAFPEKGSMIEILVR